MTWNVVHNFPGAKDTYEVPVDYPTVGYDTIIAAWFTDIFTSILAMQDSLLDLVGKVLLLAGGTMTGPLIMRAYHGNEVNYNQLLIELEAPETEETFGASFYMSPDGTFYITIATGLWISGVDDVLSVPAACNLINIYQDIIMSAGKKVDGIIVHKPVWPEDIEVSDKTKGLILKSPNNSRFRIEVSDGGVLSTEAL